MAKDIKRHLSHLKSSGGTAPAAADIVYGEIAVGYKENEEALYIKNSAGNVVTFTTAAGAEALAEDYTDKRVITKVTGDSEITVSLSASGDTSGRTLTVTHASGSAQSGFKKLSSDSYGHITGGSAVTLGDLTGLGAVSGVTLASGTNNGTLKLTVNGNATDNISVKGINTMAYQATGSYSSATQVNTALSGKVGTGRKINTASGLTGGGDLTADRTIGLVATGTSGTYGPAADVTGTEGTTIKIPQITTDAYGRVTSVTERTLTNKNSTYTVNNGVLSLQANGTTKTSFSANQSSNSSFNITSGSSNGTISVGGTDVKVKGLGGAAYLNTGTTTGTVADGGHNHNSSYYTKSELTGSSTTVVVAKAASATTAASAGSVAWGNVTGKPSVVSGSSLTANEIILGNGGTGVKASGKSIETALSSTSDAKVPTSKAVADYIAQQTASALSYKGAISSNDTLKPPYNIGDLWVVSSAGTYAGKACEVGDFLIANKTVTAGTSVTNADWDAINGENQVENKSASLASAGNSATIATVDGTDITITTPSTWTGVNKTGTLTGVTLASGTNNGTLKLTVNGSATDNIVVKNINTAAYKAEAYFVPSGRTITTASGLTGGGNLSANRTIGLAATGTSGTYGPTADVTGNNNATIKVPQITTDEYGRVTGVTERTLTLKNSTYTAANAAPPKVATASTSGTSANYARQDHTHGIDLATGDSNGQVKIAGTNVSVKGLGTAAYHPEGYFAGSGHTHSAYVNQNAWSKIKINAESTTIDADTATDTLTISGGSFVTLTSDATNDKFTIGVSTGTSSSTLARGDHSHSSYVNQNAFSNVKVGSTTIAADTTTDTLELSAATFVTLTPDATNDKVTIGVSTGTSSSTLARGDHSHNYATVAFKTVKVSGASTVDVVADAKEDTITFAKDDAITLTGDATNDKVTFGLGDIVCGDYA